MQNPNPADWTFAGHYYVGTSSDIHEVMCDNTAECASLLRESGRYHDNHNGDSRTLSTICDHCGTSHAWGCVFVNDLDGSVAQIGWVCAAKIFNQPNRLSVIQRQMGKRIAEIQKRRDKFKEAVVFLRENPMVRDFLRYRGINPFATSLGQNLMRYGSLTLNQLKAIPQALERQEREAKDQTKEVKKEVPIGRQTIKGRILGLKTREGYYGLEHKMLLDCDGYKLWLTRPSVKWDMAKGQLIELTVTTEPSRDDPYFGFGKRPTKVSLLENK